MLYSRGEYKKSTLKNKSGFFFFAKLLFVGYNDLLAVIISASLAHSVGKFLCFALGAFYNAGQ